VACVCDFHAVIEHQIWSEISITTAMSCSIKSTEVAVFLADRQQQFT